MFPLNNAEPKPNKHKLAARILIGSTFPNHQLVFNKYGKPNLQPPTAQINHSHAGEYAILAHHPTQSVGVDIEQVRPQLIKIYHRFCGPSEQAWMGINPELELLLLAWCAKEALYKAIGKKSTDFREHLLLQAFDRNETGKIHAQISLPQFQKKCTLRYQTWDNYAAVWVAI